MNNSYDLIIIGGGASGLAASIRFMKKKSAQGPLFSCAVFEKSSRVGRKIAMSGNGKCNITNLSISPDNYNTPIACRTDVDLFGFFDELSIITTSHGNLVYPYGESASAVVDILRFEAEKLGVHIFTEKIVTNISKLSQGYNIIVNDEVYLSKKVIFAVGSPASGGVDSNYILRSLNINSLAFEPALVPLVCDKKSIIGCSGVRTKCRAKLIVNDKLIAIKDGELLFKDYGLSGIVVFELSRYLKDNNVEKAHIEIDFAPDMTHDELYKVLFERLKGNTLCRTDRLFIGLFHKNISMNVLKSLGVDNVTETNLSLVVNGLKTYRIDQLKLGDMSMAQICTGGVRLSEINPITLESKKNHGFFIAGECIDVDGDCGGYNLTWAWVSGIICADNAINQLTSE